MAAALSISSHVGAGGGAGGGETRRLLAPPARVTLGW